MKKIFKITGLILAGFLLIMILLPFLFKGKITNLIKMEINKNLKAQVEFSGVGLSLLRNFPDLSLSIRDLNIRGIEEFELDTLVSMKTFRMTLDLKSVIRGEDIVIRSIFLDKPLVKAKVLADGKANWDIMIESDEEEPETGSADSELLIKLRKFIISEGRVIYDDQSLAFYMLLDQLNGNLKGDLTLDVTTLEVEASAGIFDADYEGFRYISKATLDVKTLLDFELDRLKFTFRDGMAKLNELAIGIDGWFEMPEEDINMDISYYSTKTDFKTVLSLVPAVYKKDFSSLQTSGSLSLKGFARGTYGEVTLPDVGLELKVENGMFRYPDLPAAVDQVNIDLSVFYDGEDVDKTTLDLQKFRFVMAGNQFDFSLSLRNPMTVRAVKGKAIGRIDFSKVIDVVPVVEIELKGILTSDISFSGNLSDLENGMYDQFDALGSFSLSGFEMMSTDLPRKLLISDALLTLSPRFADLKTMELKIGESDIRLSGRLENLLPYLLSDKVLKGNLDLKSTMLNLNEIMTDGQEEVPADTVPLTIVEIPKNIDFTMSSTIGRIKYDRMDIMDARGVVRVNEGRLLLDDLSMKMLNGEMKIRGEYNTQDMTNPFVDLNMDIVNFSIPATFETFNTVQKLAPLARGLGGSVSTKMSFRSKLGEDMMPVLNSINGFGSMRSASVALVSVETFDKISNSLNLNQSTTNTLRDLSMKFSIRDGKVIVDPFDMRLRSINMVLGGEHNIDQSMNYALRMAIPRTEFGAGANELINSLVAGAATKGLNIEPGEFVNVNVRIGGTLFDPKFSLDLGESTGTSVQQIKDQITTQIKSEVEGKIDALETTIKEGLSDRALKLIGDAERQAQQILDNASQAAQSLRNEAILNAAKVEKEAEGKNILAQRAAKAAADKIRKDGDTAAERLLSEARGRAQAIIDSAKKEAENL